MKYSVEVKPKVCITNCTSENLAYVLPRSPEGSHRPNFKMFLIWFSYLRVSVGKIKNIFVQFVINTFISREKQITNKILTLHLIKIRTIIENEYIPKALITVQLCAQVVIDQAFLDRFENQCCHQLWYAKWNRKLCSQDWPYRSLR